MKSTFPLKGLLHSAHVTIQGWLDHKSVYFYFYFLIQSFTAGRIVSLLGWRAGGGGIVKPLDHSYLILLAKTLLSVLNLRFGDLIFDRNSLICSFKGQATIYCLYMVSHLFKEIARLVLITEKPFKL
jgi:hypothetical protein